MVGVLGGGCWVVVGAGWWVLGGGEGGCWVGGCQEGGAPGQHLPSDLGCDKLVPLKPGEPEMAAQALTPSGVTAPSPPPSPAAQPSWLQRGGRESSAAVPGWGGLRLMSRDQAM